MCLTMNKMSRSKGIVNLIESGKRRQKNRKSTHQPFSLSTLSPATLEILEPAFGLCVVALDYDVLKMPESPGEVLEALALLQMTSDLRAGLC